MKPKWNEADRQAFKDGQRLRARTLPPKRREGSSRDEWIDEIGRWISDEYRDVLDALAAYDQDDAASPSD